ncbi:AAA family ATPase [Cylindrospermopsis raciborskii]|nr:AAA family ATPase [Cylindrospermopsis raciborskii]
MNLKNLPLGINTLSVLRENNCVYVDKTKLAYHLIRIAGRFFLSRPRRFGKSLFVDTLKEIFEGNEKLFEGLYIHDKWDWSRKFPVIKIDFADGVLKNREELDEKIRDILWTNGDRLGVGAKKNSISGIFGEIITGAREQFGERVVVLVDQYDKPILDNRVIPEDITNHGQSDLTVMVGVHIYVMEIKVIEGNQVQGNAALDQILGRNYAEKYRGEPGKYVHEIGLIFSRNQRNLIQADWR